MKQRWALQGRLWHQPNSGWHTLYTRRSRRDIRIDRVRHRGRKYGIRADYRVVRISEDA